MITPVERLVGADYSDGRLVARFPDRTWGELRGQVAAWRALLGKLPSGALLVAFDSGFAFLAALMACWQSGRVPVVAPDTRPETITRLMPGLAGILSDRRLEVDADPVPVPPPLPSGSAKPGDPLRPEAIAVELYTSGSSGVRKRIPKTFTQLSAEVEILHSLWGEATAERIPLATVSHLHIYGLLFRLLWPVCRGGVFPDRLERYWEELFRRLSDGAAFLVSSPTHLRHLVTVARGQGESLAGLVPIFSSGGPLAREVALEIAGIAGRAPIEVLGSTETGGLAWRSQSDYGEEPWRPFPRVRWEIRNRQLFIRSPMLPDPGEWQGTGDMAEAAEPGRFRLLGRQDRIVKLFEKRVSLTEMENRLERHTHITEARIVVLPGPDRRAGGGRLGAVIATQQDRIRDPERRRVFIRQLREWLGEAFEFSMLPRYWRFVHELPRDPQGKVAQDSLAEMFMNPPHGKRAVKRVVEPILHGMERNQQTILYRLEVPGNLYFLKGHFPSFPIVPGVCQLRWVVDCISRELKRPVTVQSMEAVKFHELLRPGDRFVLEIRFPSEGSGKFRYRLYSGDRKYASGRLMLVS